MGGLLTSIILMEAGKLTLQVMGIQGLQKALGDSFTTFMISLAHQVPPNLSAGHATRR
jgi:hypothetical protein